MDKSPLIEKLRHTGLLTGDQISRAEQKLADLPSNPDSLDTLVDIGLLTNYQAKQVLSGKERGLVLGQYHILDELGRGGFGQVFKARHTVMDRIVAIKVIAPELVDNDRARSWFQREVLTITQLNHPNIVMAYDARHDDDTLFLVMEYVDGRNLDSAVRKQGPLPVGVACEMMRQAGEALQHAHEKNMVHRDIKPGNLLLPRQPSAPSGAYPLPNRGARHLPAGAQPVLIKVVDFGLALLHSGGKNLTQMRNNESTFLGTPDYVAPEQAINPQSADIRSDLYSLGCTFYFALTGRPPFKADNARSTVVKHLESEADPIELLRPETPAAVCAIIRRLMSKDPGRRFQTPAEMVAELNFLNDPQAPAKPGLKASGIRPVIRVAPYNPYARNKDKTAAQTSHSQCGAVGGESTGLADQGACTVTAAPSLQSTPEKSAEPLQPAGTLADLQHGWRQWTALVHTLARAKTPAKIDVDGYTVLHKALLLMCRSRVGAADSVDSKYGRMLSLLEPWLTPEALLTADGPTLASLRHNCRQLELELGWASQGGSWWLWPVAIVALLVAGTAAWQLQQHASAEWFSKPFLTGLWKSVQARPVLGAAVAVPLAVVVSICGISRWVKR